MTSTKRHHSRSVSGNNRFMRSGSDLVKPQQSLLISALRKNFFILTASAAIMTPPVSAQTPASKVQREATLPTVNVTTDRDAASTELPASYAGGQVAKGAQLGILGNVNIMDTPFNITSYTSEFIQNQQAHTLADVLVSDPSVRFSTSSGHAFETFRIRGVDVSSAEMAINGMFGMLPAGHVPIEFIDRIEVLKGPSALFSGMAPGGSVGGVINLVPKMAQDAPLRRVSLGYQSDSQFGTSVDFSQRFGSESNFGIRINGAFSDGDTALDGQSKKRELLSAGLDFRDKDLTASLLVLHSKESYSGGTPAMYQFQSKLSHIPKAPDPTKNLFRGLYGTLKSNSVVFRTEYNFTDNISAFASAGVMNHDYSGFLNGTHARQIDANGNFTAWTTGQRGYNDNVASEAGLRSRFATGNALHQLVLHLSNLDMEAGTAIAPGKRYTSNIYHPTHPVISVVPRKGKKTSETTLSSVALVDTVSLMDEKILLTLGVREQKIKTTNFNGATGAKTAKFDKHTLTPAVAIVVKPWGPSLSLYANYVEGLSPGKQVTDVNATNYGHVFAPFKTEQKELGVKWDAGSFTHTLSLFEITKPAMIRIGNTYTDSGEQRNRGMEWNTFGEISRGLRLLGGISYIEGEQTKTADNLNNGKTAIGVPKWQANLGTEWDVPGIAGLVLDGRIIGTSGQYINSGNTQRIPGWGQVDIGGRYTLPWDKHNLVLRVSVNNLFDKRYWSGSFNDGFATLGPSRSVSASVTMDF